MLKKQLTVLAVICLTVWTVAGIVTLAKSLADSKQETASAHGRTTSNQRRSPVVEIVERMKDAVVAIKVKQIGRKECIGGTGIVVDPRGYLVTNQHVVRSTERIAVLFQDGRELPGRVIHEDKSHDLAILHVETAKNLPTLALKRGIDVFPGEPVVTIGHPLGLTNSVSTGIVSATGREVTMPTEEMIGGLIQITIPINTGNSGGPLLNAEGDLIGVILAVTDNGQGIAFALNADVVEEIVRCALTRHKGESRQP